MVSRIVQLLSNTIAIGGPQTDVMRASKVLVMAIDVSRHSIDRYASIRCEPVWTIEADFTLSLKKVHVATCNASAC
jgi:hypothetical protein